MTKLRRLLAALALVLTLLPRAYAHHEDKRYIILFAPGMSQEAKNARLKKLGLVLIRNFPRLDVAVVEKRVAHQAEPKAAGDEVIEQDFYAKWLHCEASTLEEASSCFKAKRITGAETTPATPKTDRFAEMPWGIQRVKAPGAWTTDNARSMGAGVKVAVIDTGVDCSHPDLSCDQSKGFNANNPEVSSKDDNGHGTHVAGTIAAKWNGTGVVGVAPRATIIPVKVLDAEGGGMVSDIVRGIDWAVDNGAQVINMSLGASKGSKALERAIKRAHAHNVIVVAAAGNEGPEMGTVGYPAAYPETIAVAATDVKDNIADFSSRGPQVDLAAPGDGILSTAMGGGYVELSGTSMAAPHVAGLAALAIAQGWTGPEAVRTALSGAADRVCQVTMCPSPALQGRGIVDARRLGHKEGVAVASLSSASTYRLTATTGL